MCVDVDADEPIRQEHLGQRYVWRTYATEPRLDAREKARGYEAFAVEFESLPADLEPYEGWGETMATLCRRIAQGHRGSIA